MGTGGGLAPPRTKADGDRVSRIPTLLDYLERKPGDRFALYSLALEHRKAGDFLAAEQAFGELLARHPQSGAGHYQLGLLYRDTGRAEAAREAWTRGLAALRGAEDVEARRSLGEIERALDELEDAS